MLANKDVLELVNYAYGEEFAGNLLPINYRQFKFVVFALIKEEIITKRDLAELPESKVKLITGIDGLRAKLDFYTSDAICLYVWMYIS